MNTDGLITSKKGGDKPEQHHAHWKAEGGTLGGKKFGGMWWEGGPPSPGFPNVVSRHVPVQERDPKVGGQKT